jgi:hypothetical protein
MYIAPAHLAGFIDGTLAWFATPDYCKTVCQHDDDRVAALPVSAVLTCSVELDHVSPLADRNARASLARDVYGHARVDNRYAASAALTYMFTRESRSKASRNGTAPTFPAPTTSRASGFGLRLQR